VIDPRCGTPRICQWPSVAATLFGTHVAETILASVQVRAYQQAGQMNASDPIKIITFVARKLVIIANALCKRQQEWDPNYV